KGDAVAIFSNHPKVGDIVAFNQALCCLYAAGLGRGTGEAKLEVSVKADAVSISPADIAVPAVAAAKLKTDSVPSAPVNGNRYAQLGHLLAEFLERNWRSSEEDRGFAAKEPVVITGAALGLPGTDRIFDDGNIASILRGDQFIEPIPPHFRQAMLDKRITRLVKSDSGDPHFETINNVAY